MDMNLAISLPSQTTRFVELRRRIYELYPEIDEPTLADTLEGATNLTEAIEAVITSAIEDERLGDALKWRIDQMQRRFKRLYECAAAKRRAALESMEAADLRKLIYPEFTVSVRKAAKSLVIEQSDKIPSKFWVPQDPKLDKESVRRLLLSGTAVPGVALSADRNILSVRTN